MAKVAFHTLGCKLNFSETSTIAKQFADRGFEIVDFQTDADIYVLNTCTVTENAEKECRQFARRALRQNPDAFIIVMGCYAQLRPEEMVTIKGVDVVLGSNDKFSLFSLIDNFNKKDIACVFVSDLKSSSDFGPAHSTESDSRTRAFYKIQDGCDYKCTFCTIPLARGNSRSMPFQESIKEFNNLLEEGYKEIILTGVNVGDYSSDNNNLADFLKEIIKIDSEFRVRISSIEPNLLTDEIIELTASSDKLCNHFHIPLQSGSPDILKAMQRRYNRNLYEKLIQKVKTIIPDCGIGVDIIAGFPGETDDHFQETYDFLRDLPVSYLHAFTYSERPNTKALEIKNHLEKPSKKERTNKLRMLSQRKKKLFYTQNLNSYQAVLFEGENKNGMMHGFTSNYIQVAAEFDRDLVNIFTPFRINSVVDNYCQGIILEVHNK